MRHSTKQPIRVGWIFAHGPQAKKKMETLLPGLGISCEDMGAMTSNMSSGLWEKVPRCSEKLWK